MGLWKNATLGVILFLVLLSFGNAVFAEDIPDQQQTDTSGGYAEIYSEPAGYHKWSQSFKPTKNKISSVSLFLAKNKSSLPGTFYVMIKNDYLNTPEGGEIMPGVGTPANNLSTAGQWVIFNFTPVSIDTTKKYWIVVAYNEGASPTDRIYWWHSASDSAYQNGNAFDNYNFQHKPWDFAFKTYAPYYAPIVTDAKVDMIDPPVEGQNIEHTISWDSPASTVKAYVCKTNSVTMSGCTGEQVCFKDYTSDNPLKCVQQSSYWGLQDFYAFVCDSTNCSSGFHYSVYVNPSANPPAGIPLTYTEKLFAKQTYQNNGYEVAYFGHFLAQSFYPKYYESYDPNQPVHNITSAELLLSLNGITDPYYRLKLEICKDSSNSPTGDCTAVANFTYYDVDYSVCDNHYDYSDLKWVKVKFDRPYFLKEGKKYWLKLANPDGLIANGIRWAKYNSGDYFPDGDAYSQPSIVGGDFAFKLYFGEPYCYNSCPSELTCNIDNLAWTYEAKYKCVDGGRFYARCVADGNPQMKEYCDYDHTQKFCVKGACDRIVDYEKYAQCMHGYNLDVVYGVVLSETLGFASKVKPPHTLVGATAAGAKAVEYQIIELQDLGKIAVCTWVAPAALTGYGALVAEGICILDTAYSLTKIGDIRAADETCRKQSDISNELINLLPYSLSASEQLASKAKGRADYYAIIEGRVTNPFLGEDLYATYGPPSNFALGSLPIVLNNSAFHGEFFREVYDGDTSSDAQYLQQECKYSRTCQQLNTTNRTLKDILDAPELDLYENYTDFVNVQNNTLLVMGYNDYSCTHNIGTRCDVQASFFEYAVPGPEIKQPSALALQKYNELTSQKSQIIQKYGLLQMINDNIVFWDPYLLVEPGKYYPMMDVDLTVHRGPWIQAVGGSTNITQTQNVYDISFSGESGPTPYIGACTLERHAPTQKFCSDFVKCTNDPGSCKGAPQFFLPLFAFRKDGKIDRTMLIRYLQNNSEYSHYDFGEEIVFAEPLITIGPLDTQYTYDENIPISYFAQHSSGIDRLVAFIDGFSFESGESVPASYFVEGEHALTVYALANDGSISEKSVDFNIIDIMEPAPPQCAEFKPTSNPKIKVGEWQPFEANGCTDPDGGNISYEWKFDSQVVGNQSTFNYQGKNSDVGVSHNVKVTITDDDSQFITHEWVLTVTNAPDLLLPQNNTILGMGSQLFDWTDVTGAVKYEFRATYPGGQGASLYPTQSQFTFPAAFWNTKLEDGNYFWKVRAVFSDSNGEWSETRKITRKTIPALYSPPNYSELGAGDQFLDWKSVKGADGYYLLVERPDDLKYNLLVKNDYFFVPAWFWATLPLGNYTWRVAAVNSGITGKYSEKWTFKKIG